MQVVYNANKLSGLVKEKKKVQNWLDFYQIKHTRNPSTRPVVKVLYCQIAGIPLTHILWFVWFVYLKMVMWHLKWWFWNGSILNVKFEFLFEMDIQMKVMQTLIWKWIAQNGEPNRALLCFTHKNFFVSRLVSLAYGEIGLMQLTFIHQKLRGWQMR